MPRPAADPEVIRLRPHSATILSILVWVTCALLYLDAVLRGESAGARTLPVVLLIAALVWAVLWSPQVILRRDEIMVRNVLVTHRLPLLSIDAVRIGAMLRMDVCTTTDRRETVTAWNAPTIGRDRPRERLGRIHTEALQGRAGPRRLDEGERLARDQASSRSAVIRQRWERACEAARWEDVPRPLATRSMNVLPLGILGVLVVAVVLNALV